VDRDDRPSPLGDRVGDRVRIERVRVDVDEEGTAPSRETASAVATKVCEHPFERRRELGRQFCMLAGEVDEGTAIASGGAFALIAGPARP
jgi:hypothetical protein